jgi:hypothetical protein
MMRTPLNQFSLFSMKRPLSMKKTLSRHSHDLATPKKMEIGDGWIDGRLMIGG